MTKGNRGTAAVPLFVLSIALLVSACGAEPEPYTPWITTSYEEGIETALAEARAGGASTRQIELLERARDEGSMSIDIATEAVFNVMECFEEVGGDPRFEMLEDASGLRVPGYLVGFPEELGEQHVIDELVNTCENRENYWVTFTYQQQPTSREMIGAYVMSKEPELRACLEEFGVGTDPDANGWELAIRALQHASETQMSQDCLFLTGIYGL